MTVEVLGTIFTFVGGLGMFLYGMNVMADGLQKSAGGKMKQLMGILTHNRLLAVLVGALVTAIIQSSSATTVMIVGFVNAGIVNLTQAVGVIMGANVGTTITGWLVSMNEWGAMFKPSFFAPLLIGIGAFIIMFSKKGAVVTAVIQSSSASVGILQTLAMNGVVGWNSAVFITLGQNIGTCVTALLSSAGANKTAKRAAVIHLMFNVVGAVIFGVLMFVIFTFNPSFAHSSINSVEISIFHTIFNITNTVVLFPFANLLVKLSGLIIDDSKPETTDEDDVRLMHLDDRILETPSFAVENAVKESINLGKLALKNTETAMQAFLQNDVDKANEVFKTEKLIDKYEKKITEYLVKITNLSINEKQHFLVNDLFYTISNIERVGDHAENLAELAVSKIEHDIWFSDSAYKELDEICNVVLQSFDNAIKARETENMEFVRNVVKLEDQVDALEEELRERHIIRLSKNECDSETGVIFMDSLVNLERISDHSLNIANYVRDEL